MILEAFSEYLKRTYQPDKMPEAYLDEWLMQQMVIPCDAVSETEQHHNALTAVLSPQDINEQHVARVIQAELSMVSFEDDCWFVGNTKNGERLLGALLNFCQSYDHWQFSRWLHTVQASDFKPSSYA